MPSPASPGHTPVSTIRALADIPMPTSQTEMAYLDASIRNVCEILASVIDQHRGNVQISLAYPAETDNIMDRAHRRRAARKVALPLRQSAERCRGAGSSAIASWNRYLREFAGVIRPQRAGAGGKKFAHTK